MVVCFLSSCQDYESTVELQQSATDGKNTFLGLSSKASLYQESMVQPKFGKPNVTDHYFQVNDFSSGLRSISIRFLERATGTVTYIPMIKIGNNWVLTKKMINNGWFDWRYVFSDDHTNISSITYELCSTKAVFSSTGTSSIYWPFGADGSTFANRLKWIGAREPGGCGQKWFTDYTTAQQQNIGHKYYSCGADDSYAEDWNKDCSHPNTDDGAEVRSPVDGQVIRVTVDSPSNHWGGYGNSVDIQQTASSGDIYVFRIAHLKYAPSVSNLQWVKAGVTKLGNIGMTGGTSTAPHAHMVLYKKVSQPCSSNGAAFSYKHYPMKFGINAN